MWRMLLACVRMRQSAVGDKGGTDQPHRPQPKRRGQRSTPQPKQHHPFPHHQAQQKICLSHALSNLLKGTAPMNPTIPTVARVARVAESRGHGGRLAKRHFRPIRAREGL